MGSKKDEWRNKDKKVNSTKTRKIRGEIYNKRRNYKRGEEERNVKRNVKECKSVNERNKKNIERNLRHIRGERCRRRTIYKRGRIEKKIKQIIGVIGNKKRLIRCIIQKN